MIRHEQPTVKSGRVGGALFLNEEDLYLLRSTLEGFIPSRDKGTTNFEVTLHRKDGSKVVATSVEDISKLPISAVKTRSTLSIEARDSFYASASVILDFGFYSDGTRYSLSLPRDLSVAEAAVIEYISARRPWYGFLYTRLWYVGSQLAWAAGALTICIVFFAKLPSYVSFFSIMLNIPFLFSMLIRTPLFPRTSVNLGAEAARLAQVKNIRRVMAAGLGAILLAVISGGYFRRH